MEEKPKLTGVILAPELREAIERRAAAQHTTLSRVVRELIVLGLTNRWTA